MNVDRCFHWLRSPRRISHPESPEYADEFDPDDWDDWDEPDDPDDAPDPSDFDVPDDDLDDADETPDDDPDDDEDEDEDRACVCAAGLHPYGRSDFLYCDATRRSQTAMRGVLGPMEYR